MDSQDREFESLLQQFRLRQHAEFEEFVAQPQPVQPTAYGWIVAAAATLIVLAALSAIVTLVVRLKTVEEPPAQVTMQPVPAPVEQEKPSPKQEEPALKQEKPLPKQEEPAQQSPPAPRPPDKQQADKGTEHPGRQIFNRACSQCHSTGFMNAYRSSSRDAYLDLVLRERTKGAFVTDEELPVLVDYLFKSYGVGQ